MVSVHETETDRRIPVDLLDFVENGLALGHRGLQFAIDGGLVKPQPHGRYDPAVDVASHQRDHRDIGRQHQPHRY
ncbi:MAG: hypothetical protein ACLPX7_14835 [Xanthobacteraceae bacterium]